MNVALAPGPVERLAARHAWFGPVATVVGAGAACLVLRVADPRGSDSPWPVCPFHAVTGLDCPGCGSMRAVRSLLGGDVTAAAGYNVLLVVALPVLVLGWASWAAQSVGRTAPAWCHLPDWAVRAAPWVVGAWFVLRNLPWKPFLALGAK